jgi:ApeA N-terminal domain 1
MNLNRPDMQEPFELKGVWWLPDQPEKQVAGTVSFDPIEGIVLDSIEGFEVEESEADVRKVDVILGILTDGDEVSLHKCNITKLTLPPKTFSAFRISYLIVGVHLPHHQDLKFKTISVRYHNLDEWASKLYGFDIEREWTNVQAPTTIKIRVPEDLKAKLNEQYQLKFVVASSFRPCLSPYKEIVFRLFPSFYIEASEEAVLDDFLRTIARLQDFITFGIGEPTHPIEIQAISEATKHHNPVSIYYDTILPKDTRAVAASNMRFSLGQIKEQFEEVIQEWFKKAELLEPIYILYFGTLYAPGAYLHQRFLTLVQAVEAYHRRVKGTTDLPEEDHKKRCEAILQSVPEKHQEWVKQKLQHSNEVSLRRRLNMLVDEHLSVLSEHIKKRDFVNDVVNTRNYLTHYDKSLENKAAKMLQLFCLCEKLKTLIEVCLLSELGFSREKIKSMMQKVICDREEMFVLWKNTFPK